MLLQKMMNESIRHWFRVKKFDAGVLPESHENKNHARNVINVKCSMMLVNIREVSLVNVECLLVSPVQVLSRQ